MMRAAALALLCLSVCRMALACMPIPGQYSQEHAAIVKAVLEGDKSLSVNIKTAAPAGARAAPPQMSAFQVDCKDCSDAKARALATLLQLAAPELAGPAGGGQPTLTLVNNPQPAGGMVNMSPPKPVESAFSPAAAVPVSEPADASWPAGGGGGGGGVDAYVTRKGARVAAAAGAKAGMDANAAAALLGAALTGNPLFVKTVVRAGPVTSCEAPTGTYVLFAPTVVQPACEQALHPSVVAGAARCPMLAADAFERAFGLGKRLGVFVMTAAA